MGNPDQKPPAKTEQLNTAPDNNVSAQNAKAADYRKPTRAEAVVSPEDQPRLRSARSVAASALERANQARASIQNMDAVRLPASITRRVLSLPPLADQGASDVTSQRGTLLPTGGEVSGRLGRFNLTLGQEGTATTLAVNPGDPLSVRLTRDAEGGNMVTTEVSDDNGSIRMVLDSEAKTPYIEADYNMPEGITVSTMVTPTGAGSMAFSLPIDVEVGADADFSEGPAVPNFEIAYAPKVTIPGLGTGNLKISGGNEEGGGGKGNVSFGGEF